MLKVKIKHSDSAKSKIEIVEQEEKPEIRIINFNAA